MSVIHVTALIPHRTLSNGRTTPLLTDTVDQQGNRHDVVVKCFAPEERGHQAAIAELVSSLLAQELGLHAPSPFIVSLPASFLDKILDDQCRSRFNTNPGPYFGSAYINGAPTVNAALPIQENKLDEAGSIFSFDCLTQNSDRRIDKANLLESDSGYFVIDHDLAFSDFGGIVIGGPVNPWDPAARSGNSYNFLNNHLFKEGLKGQAARLDPFQNQLAVLPSSSIESILSEVPDSWWPNASLKSSLEEYLKTSVSRSKELTEFAQTFISP